MEKERLEGLLIDYIDNKLNSIDKKMIEQELGRNADAYKLYEELKEVIQVMEQSPPLEPSLRLKTNFQKSLKAELAAQKTKIIFFQPAFYRVAATVALMVVSGAIGYWINRNAQQNRLTEIEKNIDLTRQQLADTKQLMLGMLENNQSPSQRIKGLNVAMEFTNADDEVVAVLLKTMQGDPNTNVRLAALEALSKFKDDPQVRKALIHALPQQHDPMVQISLIQLMVQLKEKGVLKDLQRIVEDAGTIQAVKDEAYSGLLKLS